MCFKFNWCLCVSLCLNHALCLADSWTQQKYLYQTLGTSFSSQICFFSPRRSQSRPLLHQILAACHLLSAAQGSHLTEHKKRRLSQFKDKAILWLYILILIKCLRHLETCFSEQKESDKHLLGITQYGTASAPCNHSYIKTQGRSFYIRTVGRYISEVRNHLFSRHFIISVD